MKNGSHVISQDGHMLWKMVPALFRTLVLCYENGKLGTSRQETSGSHAEQPWFKVWQQLGQQSLKLA